MALSLGSSKIEGTGISLMYRRVVAHWRAIILPVILACAAFQVVRSTKSGPFDLMELALLLIFTASQPAFLDWPNPRPRGAVDPGEAPPGLARDHGGPSLFVCLPVQLLRVGA
jgi:hypothetical protein